MICQCDEVFNANFKTEYADCTLREMSACAARMVERAGVSLEDTDDENTDEEEDEKDEEDEKVEEDEEVEEVEEVEKVEKVENDQNDQRRAKRLNKALKHAGKNRSFDPQ